MFMIPPPRRHPLQTVPFWLLLTAGAMALGAWKLQWLPLDDLVSSLAPFVATASKDGKQPASSDNSVVSGNFGNSVVSGNSVGSDEPKPSVHAMDVERHVGWDEALDPPEPEASVQQAGYDVPAAQQDKEPTANSAASTGPAELPQSTSPPVSVAPATPLEQLAQARAAQASGDDIAAHRGFSTVYWQSPELRPSFQAEIDALAGRIYFQRQQHYIPAYRIEPGDHLASIARRYQVSWEYLARLNQVQPEKIQAGRSLKVLQGPFHAIVDLERFELTIHAYGYYVRRYSVGIGRDGATPVGVFQVVDKVVNPTYYGPDGVVAADDPANPIGERWMAINDASGSLDGYGIHGTTEPDSIGKAASRGCIRLRDADLLEVYDLLTVGSEVTIRR